ncbi:TonB C-terminal domain-containing protein [Granulicella arctica]|uniref:Outer membrane biosynthesis protein TonB n=1 Tax=Granulicella arctica TaxID=940613 RepID=A0A7Y9PGZ0_9BACT|nr:TonB C-terminal domain-containing protein [Granulicella arctica]NYF78948.1 outer membrane biosynthesis protein TonB [Granulicella arctica]
MSSPTLETPPNPVEPTTPLKVRTGRFGELEEHELIHLLDTLDDERAKARFRESIYISVFVYIVVGWFLFYGPRVLFHQPRLINPSDVLKQREITNLQMPSDIARELQHAPKTPKSAAKSAPAPRPTIDQKTLEAMRRAAEKPAPAAPQPAPVQQQAQPTPLPPVQHPVQPAPPTLATIPDAPKPTPNFGGQSQSAGETIRQAVQGASRDHGSGGNFSEGVTPSKVGVGTGVDILSDTMGVNFDPYLRKIMRQIYNTWIPLIPEEARPPLNKRGITQIRFTILPDGRIGGMTLEGSTHDDALNRAAWGSITGVGQFPSLPSEFHGPNLELRIHYLVNEKQE